MSDAVFGALGDPTRRSILARMAQTGPVTATSLAQELAISRQAVAKHLGILADAGMASAYRSGRESRFEADLTALAQVQGWIEQVENDWHGRLAALARAAETEQRRQRNL